MQSHDKSTDNSGEPTESAQSSESAPAHKDRRRRVKGDGTAGLERIA